MANKSNSGPVPVYGGEDGFLAVKGVEDKLLNRYLEVYAAQLEGYKVEEGTTPKGNRFIRITQKISFPLCEKEANASMWAYFIAKICHPTANSDKLKTWSNPRGGGGWDVYASWDIWPDVTYRESQRAGKVTF